MGISQGTGTFRAQDLSFPRTNSPYGELSFPRLFVPGNFRSLFPGNFRSLEPGNFRSLGTKVPWNFCSRALSFSGTFVSGDESSWELSFPGPLFRGTFVPRTFRSQELSFLRLFYKALAMNADSYSNCQFVSQQAQAQQCLFSKNKLSKLKVCSCCFFLLNKNAK